jgi:hypothetical protein
MMNILPRESTEQEQNQGQNLENSDILELNRKREG